MSFTVIASGLKKRGGAASCEIRLQAVGDRVTYVHFNCSPDASSPDGEFNYWAAMSDISEMKRLEKERQDLNRRLRRYTRKLRDANRELEAFNDSVAHDLRAPLRSIGGFAEILAEEARDSLDEKSRGHLGRIIKSAEHMGRILDGLQDLSRLARSELQWTNIDLAGLAREIVRQLRERDPEHRPDFLIPANLSVKGDPRMLRIVLDNLFSNAWKFTRHTEHTRIELGEKEGVGEHVIFVRDNGAGFNPQYADKLFQPFQRLHSDKEFTGVGVGLAIVERIIKRHGGEIWAEGQKGMGATIYFALPEEPEE